MLHIRNIFVYLGNTLFHVQILDGQIVTLTLVTVL